MSTQTEAFDIEIKEWTPPKRSTNPNNKTGLADYDCDEYVIKRKYIYRVSDNFKVCNMPAREHHDKWYSQHDQNGDAYWCPDCDDMQVG
jgi:hypothetical protein